MIDVTNGYVDVMRRPRIQVGEHLHYVPGIPCQENTCTSSQSRWKAFSSIFLVLTLIDMYCNVVDPTAQIFAESQKSAKLWSKMITFFAKN